MISNNEACKNLVPVHLTFVEYEKGDFVGYVMAYMSLSILFVISVFLTLAIFKRDLYTIFAFAGVLLNESINNILKRFIAHPRPKCHFSEKLINDYGMPSSHSQAAWFITGYYLSSILFRVMYYDYPQSYFMIVLGTCCSWSIIVSYSRIYLKYHTWAQVIIGGILGYSFGLLWFYIVHEKFSRFFLRISKWKISKLLGVSVYSIFDVSGEISDSDNDDYVENSENSDVKKRS